jgi:hypothetical protein
MVRGLGRAATGGAHPAMRINRTFLHYCRLVHVYLMMLGLFVMLLFGVTGFTVNHEDWFSATTPRVTELTGQSPAELVAKNDRLGVVEHLRRAFGISGALTGYDDLGEKLSIGFREPGRNWEVEIEKNSGKTSVHQEAFNFTALINNLHRGRYAGAAWKWIIDICAVLIVIACITGSVLWMALPKRRRLGIGALALGTIGTLVVYVLLVPGKDQRETAPAERGVVSQR